MDLLVIEGATVVDGSGSRAFRGTVGIRDDRIAFVEREHAVPVGDAAEVLAGKGLVVAPGFVDVHNHSDLGPLVDPSMPSTLRQGVTTIVVGNCGMSPWPDSGAAECARLAGGDPDRLDLTFRSFGGYLERLEAARPAVNIAALVGHGAVRMQAMGPERRAPTEEELTAMRRTVALAMDEGAAGFSTGLIYVPGLYAQTDEIAALATTSARAGGIYASHIRGEGEHLFRATDEAVRIGREAGGPAHVSHLKCETSLVWGRAGELLARFHGNDDVTADQYPYTAWASVLWSLLPPWAPVHELSRLLSSNDTRSRLIRAVEEGEGEDFQSSVKGLGWDRIVIESTADASCNGLSIADVAAARGVEPVDACFALLLEEQETACIGHAMDDADVRTILADPDVMVASDGVSMSPEGPLGALPVHPRNYGTFPRALEASREGALPLEAAVRKMTSLPAERFGLADRGRIEEGAFADLVLFDPTSVADRARFGAPHVYPDGLATVIVNGVIAWRAGGDAISCAGRVLRRG